MNDEADDEESYLAPDIDERAVASFFWPGATAHVCITAGNVPSLAGR